VKNREVCGAVLLRSLCAQKALMILLIICTI